jgi:16S rRNA processing protein RimM
MDRTVFATVRKVHGVRGGVRISASSDNLELLPDVELFFVKDGNEWLTLTLEDIAGTFDDPIVYFEEIVDRDQAVAIRGLPLYVDSDVLPNLQEDEYKIADLVGCQVIDETGVELGKVSQVDQPGQHEILVVRKGEEEHLIPFVKAWILEVNIADRLIRVAREEDL